MRLVAFFWLAVAVVVLAVGCDAGGLLVVGSTSVDGGGGSPVVLGPSVNEIVNGGNVAKNGKYKVVYTLGQPTPNQGPMKGPNNRDNGGIVGAMNGP
jgi:hypothetical protein